MWNSLVSYAERIDGPWLVGGDFNVVQYHSEVTGGNPQSQSSIDDFNIALLDCGLEDAGFIGSPFTWTNGRTRRRLDRAVVNSQWAGLFSVLQVSHLNRTVSDHSPLLVSVDRSTTRGPSRFRFLHTWLRHSDFLTVVRQSWSAPIATTGMIGFQQKLSRLKRCLKVWNKEVFGNVFERVQAAEEEVAQRERIYDISGSAQDRVSFSEARARLQHALLCEESFLRQQSSVRWIREGDSNTRFFHAMVRKKRHTSYIHRIQEADSSWISEPTAIASSAVSYFRELLSVGTSQFQRDDFSFIPDLVSEEDDADLCREPTLEEVRQTVFSIDSDSAPGPDGFCSRFYQFKFN